MREFGRRTVLDRGCRFGRLARLIVCDWNGLRPLAGLCDAGEYLPGPGRRLGVDIPVQGVGQSSIKLDGRSAPPAVRIELHQVAGGRLMQRIEPQDLNTDADGVFALAVLHQQFHQARKRFDGLVEMAGGFGAAPGLKFLAVQFEAIQEPAAAVRGGSLQLRPAGPARQAAESQGIDIEGGDIEHDIFLIRRQKAMIDVPQRLAQPPDAGSQIIEQGLIRGIAPQQRRKLSAGLAAFGAEREIGQSARSRLPGKAIFWPPGSVLSSKPPNSRNDQRAKGAAPPSTAVALLFVAGSTPNPRSSSLCRAFYRNFDAEGRVSTS